MAMPLFPTGRSQAPSIVLNTPDTVKFIKLYQQQEVLWNVNYPNHSNRLFRTQGLQAISRAMGNNWSEQQVKDKILSLRSRYSKELVKVRVSISSGADVYTPVWRFFPLLDSFLRPFCVTRKTDTAVVRAFHQKLMQGRVQSGPEPDLSSALPVNRPQYQDVSSTKGYPAGYQGIHLDDEDDDDDLQIIEDDGTEDSTDQDPDDSQQGQACNADVDNSLSLSDLYPSHDDQGGDKKENLQIRGDISSRMDPMSFPSVDGTPTPTSAQLAQANKDSSNVSKRSVVSEGHDTLFYNQSCDERVTHHSHTSDRSVEIIDRKPTPAKRVKTTAPPSPPAPPLPSRNSSSVTARSHSQAYSALETETTLHSSQHTVELAADRHKPHGRDTRTTSTDASVIAGHMVNAMQKLITTMIDKAPHSESMDADSAFASHIAYELRKLDEDLKSDVKFDIQRTLYEAQKKMRTRKEPESESNDSGSVGYSGCVQDMPNT